MLLFRKDSQFKRIVQNPALKISLGYLLVGLFYIYFSDRILLLIVQDQVTVNSIQTIKGFGFIIASTSALLVYLLSTYVIKLNNRLLKKIDENKDAYNAKLQQQYEELQKLHAELEKRVEERTSELVIANKDLKTFSSSITHDMGSPLCTIINFANILKKNKKGNLDEGSIGYVDNILICSKQMNKLMVDILKYTRFGREAIVQESVDLNKVFEEVLTMLNFRIQESAASIKIAKNMPVIRSEPVLLTQIFSNLIDNALIYKKKDSIPEITVDFKIENNSITLSFKDNGIGIKAENFEKVFNIFQRLNTDEEYKGTGIGLAIVNKNSELLKGKVWIQSSLIGEGTTFCVKLPLNEAIGNSL